MSTAMVLWALVMAVVLFMLEARLGSRTSVEWVGIGATALFGAILGWRRRIAATFVAPIVSWLVAWFPLWIAAMIRDGFFKGLVVGFFWVTVGWLLIAMVEFVWLFIVATLVRMLRGSSGRRERDVIVFGPDGSPH